MPPSQALLRIRTASASETLCTGSAPNPFFGTRIPVFPNTVTSMPITPFCIYCGCFSSRSLQISITCFMASGPGAPMVTRFSTQLFKLMAS